LKQKVGCVLVTYNPDSEVLVSCVESIIANGARCIIVDNASKNVEDFSSRLSGQAEFIFLDKNLGIAAAQNAGIAYCIEYFQSDFVLLSDQDSVFPVDYVDNMLAFYLLLDGKDIAAVAPTFFDRTRSEKQPIVQLSPFTRKIEPSPGKNFASHVIASGMLIPVRSFDIVGLKNDKLFIDWVDMEWCWRANFKHKLKVYVNGDVEMDHKLGDSYKSVFGKKVVLRSSFRHYFMIRNAIYLALRASYLPIPLRVELFLKSFVWACLFPLLSSKKINEAATVAKAIKDGIIGRLGHK
jgi:rhamnosyltransferase